MTNPVCIKNEYTNYPAFIQYFGCLVALHDIAVIHALATVIFIGYLVLLALIYLPGTKDKPDIEVSLVLGAYSKQSRLWFSFEPAAFFCSDANISAKQIIVWFAWRWNIEVTFEELRGCLGFDIVPFRVNPTAVV